MGMETTPIRVTYGVHLNALSFPFWLRARITPDTSLCPLFALGGYGLTASAFVELGITL